MLKPLSSALASRITAKIARLAFITILYMIVSSFVLDAFMTKWGFLDNSRLKSFSMLMTYTAHKPWAYRVLTPLLVNSVTTMLPKGQVQSREEYLLHNSALLKYVRMQNTPEWNLDTSVKYHLTYAYLFLCLMMILFSARYLTYLVFPNSQAFHDFSPAVMILLLPLTFVGGGYMYDFPELLFMTLILVVLVRDNIFAYYIIYVVAILNKESNVLLFSFYLAFYMKAVPPLKLAKHLSLQACIGTVLILLVRICTAENPGTSIQNHIIGNIIFWSKPSSYFLFFKPFPSPIPFPRGVNIVSLFVVAWLIFHRWGDKPIWVKRLFGFSAVLNLPLFLCCCWRDELRNLSLMFPAVYLLSVHTLFQITVDKNAFQTKNN